MKFVIRNNGEARGLPYKGKTIYLAHDRVIVTGDEEMAKALSSYPRISSVKQTEAVESPESTSPFIESTPGPNTVTEDIMEDESDEVVEAAEELAEQLYQQEHPDEAKTVEEPVADVDVASNTETEPEPVVEPEKETGTSFEDMSLTDLQQLAQAVGIKAGSKTKKKLIELLKE